MTGCSNGRQYALRRNIVLDPGDSGALLSWQQYYFTNRVVNAWNSLPDHVVLSKTMNTFKSLLDKFWQHQDMIYDFQAELHGTGSHSLHSS